MYMYMYTCILVIIVLTEYIGLYVGILLAKNIHVCVQARCL